MIFFPSKLGTQLLKSMQIDTSNWIFHAHFNAIENRKLNICLNYHSHESSIYRLEINGHDYKQHLTFMDNWYLRRAFRTLFKFPNYSQLIPNSTDDPELFL